MSPSNGNLLIKIFYQNAPFYQNFNELTDDEIEALNEEAERLTNSLQTERTVYDKYVILMKLFKLSKKPREFDAHLYLLIKTLDPNLAIYNLFKEANITSKKEIENANSDKEKQILELQRKKELALYENSVRNEIGFYEAKLIKYERDFNNKFNLEKEIQK